MSLNTTITTQIPSAPITYFGVRRNDDEIKAFGVGDTDRKRHFYVLGKTGTGKSTMLHNMCLQDIYRGKGVCFIDPHGDSIDYILDKIPLHRKEDLIYFNPSDTEFPIGLNVMQSENGEQDFLICSSIMSVFKRIWSGMWSSRMEYILNNTILALLEQKDATLIGVIKMLSDNDYRDQVVKDCQNPLVKNFWLKEFALFNDKYRTEAIAPIMNKIGQFFSTSLTRNILGQTTSSFNIRNIMDNKKILLVNLSKGQIGEDNSNLIGSLLVTKIQLAALSRASSFVDDRPDFNLFVDEFQNFTTDSFTTILSEARKYGLNLVLAHQYIDQLNETGNENIKNAIFGNVGSFVIFQVGSKDADIVLPEFEPVFERQHLINLNNTEIAVRLSINGRTSQPFLAKTLPPIFHTFGGKKEYFVSYSRAEYGKDRIEVEKEITAYLEDGSNGKKIKTKPKRPNLNAARPTYTPNNNSSSTSTAQNQPSAVTKKPNYSGYNRRPNLNP